MGYNKDTHSIAAVYCEKDGTFSCDYEGECTLFPSKEQRDWSKFVRFWDKPKKENTEESRKYHDDFVTNIKIEWEE